MKKLLTILTLFIVASCGSDSDSKRPTAPKVVVPVTNNYPANPNGTLTLPGGATVGNPLLNSHCFKAENAAGSETFTSDLGNGNRIVVNVTPITNDQDMKVFVQAEFIKGKHIPGIPNFNTLPKRFCLNNSGPAYFELNERVARRLYVSLKNAAGIEIILTNQGKYYATVDGNDLTGIFIIVNKGFQGIIGSEF